jgi:hypothetical protein
MVSFAHFVNLLLYVPAVATIATWYAPSLCKLQIRPQKKKGDKRRARHMRDKSQGVI